MPCTFPLETLSSVGNRLSITKLNYTKTQDELQAIVNRLVYIGRKYRMEVNIDKSQVMRVSKSNKLLQIKVGNRELK